MKQQNASKILIVEDEPKIAKLLSDYLIQSGFECEWLSRGDEVMPWLEKNEASLALLDVMLPGLDGFEVCKQIRKISDLPLIMVTARVEEIDRLIGLEIGADDYVCKPFSPREVVSRVKTVLRRTQQRSFSNMSENMTENMPSTLLAAEPKTLSLNSESLTLSYGQNDCQLTKLEARIFKTLCKSPGRIYSRDQLMDQIYDDNHIVSDRTIDSHVKKLRKKIVLLNANDSHIQSVYGTGYKFEPYP